ncbi:hypothetical protein Poly41_48490 [Novipirellula artificiosorum]|uniref:Uncharacterized protein n=1 Tax=Novipirellula artificiosorum TaxID=2528016 RepID=A0A5C6DFU0_9BACT|nr:hypothetical protein Poly41_48490 [Novipirellula artificiosorum]
MVPENQAAARFEDRSRGGDASDHDHLLAHVDSRGSVLHWRPTNSIAVQFRGHKESRRMNLNAIAPADSGSKNSARVFPFASAASAVDRSPPWSPPKSWAWSIETRGHRTWPTDLWGDCGYRRSDHGDGDENSSREQSLPIGGNKRIHVSRGQKLK